MENLIKTDDLGVPPPHGLETSISFGDKLQSSSMDSAASLFWDEAYAEQQRNGSIQPEVTSKFCSGINIINICHNMG